MVINYCSNVAMKFTRVGQISKFLSPDAVSSSQLTRESLAGIPNTGEIATRTDCERSLVSKRSLLPCPWQVWCGLDKDIGKDSITDKDIKEVTSLLENPTTVLPSKEDANHVLNIIGNIAEGNLEFRESFSHLDKSTFLDDVCCGSPTPVILSWAPGLFYSETQGLY